VLVVGYGNSLRSDDGVGQVVAERLAADLRLQGAEIRAEHQLTFELAQDVAGARLMIFVDAADGVPPGEVVVRELAPSGARGSAASGPASLAADGAPSFSHRVDPASLLRLASDLWGAAPRTLMIEIGPASLELGDRLTPLVEAAVPRAVEAVVAALGEPGPGAPGKREED
jgi:hydrogenase maturation protease